MTREEIKEKAIEKADEILMILGRGPGKNKVLDYHEKNEAAYHDLVEIARSVGMEITNETAISTIFCVEVMRRLVKAKTGKWVGLEYDAYADGNPVYDVWECSCCGEEHYGEEDTLTPYCPNCGAEMGDDEE